MALVLQAVLSGEPNVLFRRPLLLSRRARQAIEVVVTLSAAVLLSYLVLQTPW